ncbi:MAG: branched-chain amino acid ABC transporter substrate-binding protein [Deltaproteobacteria bacterium]|nr:branched-chain amino acid ABC transporter substrate-binding protein [Deltaproteobacteria bacterium]
MRRKTWSFLKVGLSLAVFSIFFVTAALGAPLKVGIVETLSGPQASTGLKCLAAVKYVLNAFNAAGGWGGAPVQLLEYDSQGNPAGAADKVKAAIADGVQIIFQGSSSAIGGQVSDDVRKHNLRNPGNEIIYHNLGAQAMEFTGKRNHFYHFRYSPNAEIYVKALVSAMKKAGVLGKRVYSMNQNYSWGQDVQKAILDYASQGGYQVVGATLHDVNKIQDFAPYVAKIKDSNAETVITGNWSNDLLLLMKGVHAANLKVRFATIFLDQPGNIGNAGEVALGYYLANGFNAEGGGKEGEKFAGDYKAKTGHYPDFVEPPIVFGMQMLCEALKKVKPEGGKLNTTTLVKAIEAVQITTPVGKWRMRAEDHQVLLPIVLSVVSKDAKYKVDDTDMGFKPVKVLTADEAACPVQADNAMQRPK